MPATLYHVSDTPGIPRFDPRPALGTGAGQQGDMVWAIDAEHLHNYLLPRDCPRVTFYALPESKPEDVERLIGYGTARYVVAIESRWLPEVMRRRLFRYDLPGATFELADAGAGYYISRVPVVPRAEMPIDDLLGELITHNV